MSNCDDFILGSECSIGLHNRGLVVKSLCVFKILNENISVQTRVFAVPINNNPRINDFMLVIICYVKLLIVNIDIHDV